MKDYMASGSFARGKEEKAATASMVFVGNINQSVDVLLKTSSLFDPFPPEMGTDTAFLDRMHCYIPVGRYRSSARSISPTTMASSPTIWQSLFGSFARSSTVMHWTSISALARTSISATPLPSARWLAA